MTMDNTTTSTTPGNTSATTQGAVPPPENQDPHLLVIKPNVGATALAPDVASTIATVSCNSASSVVSTTLLSGSTTTPAEAASTDKTNDAVVVENNQLQQQEQQLPVMVVVDPNEPVLVAPLETPPLTLLSTSSSLSSLSVWPCSSTTATLMEQQMLQQQQEQQRKQQQRKQQQQQQQQQPLSKLLQQYRVRIPEDNNDPDQLESITLLDMDAFLAALEDAAADAATNKGSAPGYFTCQTDPSLFRWRRNNSGGCGNENGDKNKSNTKWKADDHYLPYETLEFGGTDTNSSSSDDSSDALLMLPVVPPSAALQAHRAVRQSLVERIAFLRRQQQQQELFPNASSDIQSKTNINDDEDFCSCISQWDHANNIKMIFNQTLEQMMVRESSACLKTKFAMLDWDASYEQPTPTTASDYNDNEESMEYHPHIPVTLLCDRDNYLQAFVTAALECQHSIRIMTCYLFYDCPAQQYILFDLLPYLCRERPGLKVQILIDMIPIESFTIQSVFHEMKPSGFNRENLPPTTTMTGNNEAAEAAVPVTVTSFLRYLPANAPMYTPRKFASAADMFQTLLNMNQTIFEGTGSNIETQFWCARDQAEKFRIKNHVKCAIFDDYAVMMGGSNLTPTIKSATADLDIFIAGQGPASSVSQTYQVLWNAMKGITTTTPVETNHPAQSSTKINDSFVEDEKKIEGDDAKEANASTMATSPGSQAALLKIARSLAQEQDASVTILRSTPSCEGEDNIFRVVLDRIRTAQSEVLIGMGHSCFPRSFAHAVEDAVERRGVTVKLLVNSLHSDDLRTCQRDLFLSLAYLLKVAPHTEVYATVKRTISSPSDDGDGSVSSVILPEFLHGKYVVVDNEWSAVGSWNLWTRSAFHEIEHEAFIKSRSIAQQLRHKFHKDQALHAARIMTPEQCLDTKTFLPKGCFFCQGFGPFFEGRCALTGLAKGCSGSSSSNEA